MKYFIYILSIFLFWSCTSGPEKADDTKLKIVCTTGILGDCIKNIVGDSAEVTALMGPSIDPHLYQPLHDDYDLLNDADLIIYNGLHLEGKMADILHKISRQKKVLALSDFVNQNELIKADGFDTYDPHLWFDVLLWKEGIAGLATSITKIDSLNAAYYTQNTNSYLSALDELHRETLASIDEIPKNQRLLITAHDAFNYFGKRYNIEVVGLQGVSTLSQAGIKDVTNLVDLIIKRNIKAIFIESSIPKKQLEVVIDNCKTKGHQVNIGGVLYSDALGAKDSPASTYIDMIKHNAHTINKSLK